MNIEDQLTAIFKAYEIDELSISTLPAIIEEIKDLIASETESAFQRGVYAGQEVQ